MKGLRKVGQYFLGLEAIAAVVADILVSGMSCNVTAVTRKRKCDQLPYSLKVDNGII